MTTITMWESSPSTISETDLIKMGKNILQNRDEGIEP